MKGDDRLLYLLRRAEYRLREHVKSRLKQEGISVSHAQSGILFLLKENGSLPMSELGRRLDVDASAVTGLVDRLEKGGFVVREPHATDRRVNLVTITGTGAAEAERCGSVIRDINEKVKEGFTQEEIDVYRRVLESFFEKFPLAPAESRRT